MPSPTGPVKFSLGPAQMRFLGFGIGESAPDDIAEGTEKNEEKNKKLGTQKPRQSPQRARTQAPARSSSRDADLLREMQLLSLDSLLGCSALLVKCTYSDGTS